MNFFLSFLVGIEVKNGIKYSFIDYESTYSVQEAYSKIPKERYLGMKDALQVRLRFDKTSKPSFDDGSFRSSSTTLSMSEGRVPDQQDKRTIHLSNLPHNINKVFYILNFFLFDNWTDLINNSPLSSLLSLKSSNSCLKLLLSAESKSFKEPPKRNPLSSSASKALIKLDLLLPL